jgi:hypothetical protein
MSIDLRTERPGGTWVRRFGDHEAKGFGVSIGNKSAQVTLTAQGVTFAVDSQDIPTAWDEPIDVLKLREELVAAIIRHMSPDVLEALFGEIYSQRQRAYSEGENAARTKIRTTIREALGL